MFQTVFSQVRLILAAVIFIIAPYAHAAEKEVYTSGFSNVAIRGYDPVAYFNEGKPVKGKDQYSVSLKGATWRFSSAANRDSFQNNPEKFSPQYGGYCAWAVSQGYTASTDPEAWHIEKGKLYLNYSKGVQRQWKQDVPGNIAKGDANWPKVLE